VTTWRLFPFASFSAAQNMAVDEAIFREVQRTGGPPTVRLYGWLSPAVSIGYFQDAAAEINLPACRARGVSVVRRPTGGRAVYHDDDLTYAVVAPETIPLFPPTIAGAYQAISRCLARGLKELGLAAALASGGGADEDAGRPRRETGKESGGERIAPAACFAVPARHELLVAGRKICGSAQMRSRGTFLQQGSLLMSFDPEKTAAVLKSPAHNPAVQIQMLRDKATSVYEHLPRAVTREAVSQSLLAAFQDLWQVSFAAGELSKEEERLSAHLVETKYGQEHWTLEGKKRP